MDEGIIMLKNSSINRLLIAGLILAIFPAIKIHSQRNIEIIESTDSSLNHSDSKTLKRKVAIGRFSNETQYAKGLFYDKDNDPMGKQALDILSSRLAASNKFLLLERGDINALLAECQNNGNDFSSIGADYMIIGSITEYGRKTIGKSNGFSAEKSQIVEAAVAIRLIDLSTGLIIYSDEGKGESILTTKSGLFKSQSAEYDATLSDKAISAAINQLVENIINKCTDKPWRTYFLTIDNDAILIAGGRSQGLTPGDELIIKTKGKKVKNPQTGIIIELPGKPIGKIRIDECGGDTPETEYSFVSALDQLDINTDNMSEYIIEEK